MPGKPSKKVGVIQTIVESLEGASESNPITKEEILEELATRFPARDEAKMMSTVRQQVPNKIRAAGHDVRKNKSGGYWITDQLETFATELAKRHTAASSNGDSSEMLPVPPSPHASIPQTIRIDGQVWLALQKHAVPFVETPNDVLRRLLGLSGK